MAKDEECNTPVPKWNRRWKPSFRSSVDKDAWLLQTDSLACTTTQKESAKYELKFYQTRAFAFSGTVFTLVEQNPK
jgi:hypothetical protein